MGMIIPDTRLLRCEMSREDHREHDMEAIIPLLADSLRQGNNAYIHCVSGISRAPLAAAILCAVFMNISFGRAKDIITQIRNIKDHPEMEGPWIDRLLRNQRTRQ